MCPYLIVKICTKIMEFVTKSAPIIKCYVIFGGCNKLKYTITYASFNTLVPDGVGLEFFDRVVSNSAAP